MLASRTYFDMCGNFILKFLELVVSVDKVNLETAISENGKDLFYTIDDVFGSSFVRCTCCFRLAFADTIKCLSCMEFDFGRFNEKIGCALNIKEIDVKIF